MADEEQKIFIDEDWKAQVQREKEKAKEEAEKAKAEEPEEVAEEPETVTGFSALVQSLATQCLFALGVIAPQGTEQVTIDIGQAKYVIDTLLMLREKTEGNLTSDEDGMLGEAIGELQRIYVVRAQQAQEAALKQSGIDMNNLKGPQQ